MHIRPGASAATQTLHGAERCNAPTPQPNSKSRTRPHFRACVFFAIFHGHAVRESFSAGAAGLSDTGRCTAAGQSRRGAKRQSADPVADAIGAGQWPSRRTWWRWMRHRCVAQRDLSLVGQRLERQRPEHAAGQPVGIFHQHVRSHLRICVRHAVRLHAVDTEPAKHGERRGRHERSGCQPQRLSAPRAGLRPARPPGRQNYLVRSGVPLARRTRRDCCASIAIPRSRTMTNSTPCQRLPRRRTCRSQQFASLPDGLPARSCALAGCKTAPAMLQ